MICYLERVWFLLLGQQKPNLEPTSRGAGSLHGNRVTRVMGDSGADASVKPSGTPTSEDALPLPRARRRGPRVSQQHLDAAHTCSQHVRGLAVNPQGAEGADAPLSGARAWGVKRAEPAAPSSLPTYEWPRPDNREGRSLMTSQGRPWPGFLLLCNPSPPHTINPPGDPSLQLLEAGLHNPCPAGPPTPPPQPLVLISALLPRGQPHPCRASSPVPPVTAHTLPVNHRRSPVHSSFA